MVEPSSAGSEKAGAFCPVSSIVTWSVRSVKSVEVTLLTVSTVTTVPTVSLPFQGVRPLRRAVDYRGSYRGVFDQAIDTADHDLVSERHASADLDVPGRADAELHALPARFSVHDRPDERAAL